MSVETDNVAMLKQAYEAWRASKGQNADCWMSIVHENVDFGSGPRGEAPLSFARPMSRREELKSYFDAIRNDWTMVRYDMDHFIAQDDWVVVRGVMSWTHNTTKKNFESPKADVWQIKNGQVVSYFEHFDTMAAARATMAGA